MHRYRINDLVAFAVVARERSFTRAARSLGLSPSALSHAMRGLEGRLGVTLLARTTRAVAPTDAGQRLLSRLTVALDEIDQGLAELADRAIEPSGRIRLTTFRYFADTILQPGLPAFLRNHPAVQVEVDVDDRLTDVVTAEFDAGIRFGNHVAKGMVAVRIGPDVPMLAVATPDYLRRAGTPGTPADLARHACINYRMTNSGTLFGWVFTRDGKEEKVQVDGPLVANYGPLVLAAVRDSVGIGFLLEEDVANDIAERRLIRVLPDWTSTCPGPHLYHVNRGHTPPAMAALIEALRDHGMRDRSPT